MSESPYYRFYRRASYPLPIREWRKLPRVPGYKNEYFDGKAQLTPRPGTFDMLLALEGWSPPDGAGKVQWEQEAVAIRPLREQDWPELPAPFLSAFGNQPPLSCWGRYAARRAARCIMEWSRQGRDGKLVPGACFAAWTRDGPPAEGGGAGVEWICGAAIVTLVSSRWLTPTAGADASPDPDLPANEDGRLVPHLDWVFVSQWVQRQGIGTLLLESVVASLREAGFPRLASTCLMSNTPSLLWHWRNGFTPAPGGWRARRVRRME